MEITNRKDRKGNLIYKVETAQQIYENLKYIVKPNQALTAITDCTIGISTESETGYYPTRLGLKEYNYEHLQDLCDQANKLLFPNRTEKESMLIVLRSMR